MILNLNSLHENQQEIPNILELLILYFNAYLSQGLNQYSLLAYNGIDGNLLFNSSSDSASSTAASSSSSTPYDKKTWFLFTKTRTEILKNFNATIPPTSQRKSRLASTLGLALLRMCSSIASYDHHSHYVCTSLFACRLQQDRESRQQRCL